MPPFVCEFSCLTPLTQLADLCSIWPIYFVAGYQRSIAEIKDRPEAVGNPSLEANVFNTPFMTANPTLPRFYVLTMLMAAIVFGQPFALKAAGNEASSPEPAVPDRAITVDVNTVQGPLDTSFKECIGAGRANEGFLSSGAARVSPDV